MPKGVYKKSKEHKRKIGLSHMGLSPSIETRKKISETNKKKVGKLSNNWKGGKPCCIDCGKKLSDRKRIQCKSCCRKGKPQPQLFKLGKSHPRWKGGISPINNKIRNSVESRLWRKSVFGRDNYICQICLRRGGYLEADHIKPFAYFPELRFKLENGRTLCKDCHRKTDTYGSRFYVSN